MSNDHIDHDAVTREAAYTLASQHDIDLFRVIRRSGRKDRDKAKAVSLYLAETIIAEAAAMRERAAGVASDIQAQMKESMQQRGISSDTLVSIVSMVQVADTIATAIRALPATGEVGR